MFLVADSTEMHYRPVANLSPIVILGLVFLVSPVSPVKCYVSDTPHLDYDRISECDNDEVCFVEFFINNVSGAPVHTYDRFCIQAAHCTRHNIPLNEDVDVFQLSTTTQNAFYKLHTNMTKDDGEELITNTWFRCCNTKLCNDIDLRRVHERLGIWPSLNSNFNPHSFSLLSLLIILHCLVLHQ